MEAEAELGNLAGVRHVLLVLSGKGGVGKSTLSAELALALRHEGKKVGILDVDLCGPSIPRMLRAQGRAVHQCDSGWAPVFVDREQSIALMSVGFLLEKPNEAVVWRGPKKSGSGRVRGSQCGREDPRQRPASSVSAGGWEAAAGPGRTPQHGGSPRSPDQAVRVGRGLGTVGLPGRGHAPRDLGRAHGRRGSPAPPQAPAGPPGHHPAGGVRGGRAAGADLLQEGGAAGAGGRGEHERLHVPALLGVHQHLLQGWRRGAGQTRGGPLPRLCASGPRAHQEPGGGPRLHPGVPREPCVPRADRHSPEGSGRGCRSALLTRAATATPGASERAVRSSGPGTCGPPCRGQSRSQRPSLSACDRPAWGLVPRPLAPLRAHLSRSGKGGHLVTSEDPAPLNASRCTVSSPASRLASASPPQRALHLVWGDPGELPGDTALGPFAHLGQGRGRHRVVPM